MLITRKSALSMKIRSREIDVTPEQLEDWKNGVLIQIAMPLVSKSDREFIKTGIVDEEWDTLREPA